MEEPSLKDDVESDEREEEELPSREIWTSEGHRHSN